MSESVCDDQPPGIPIQVIPVDPIPTCPADQTHHHQSYQPRRQSPLAVTHHSGGGRKSARDPREHQQNLWSEIQSLRRKLAEHEETIEKLKAAFGVIAVALDIQRPVAPPDPFGFNGSSNAATGSSTFEMPANRPPRLLRRGGFNNMNNRDESSGNSVYHKNHNKGKRRQFDAEKIAW